MKTAYELAMERLNKDAPAKKLSPAQKQELAELDSKYAAKVAEREIALKDEMARAGAAGEVEKVETVRQQWVAERRKLQTELEEKKINCAGRPGEVSPAAGPRHFSPPQNMVRARGLEPPTLAGPDPKSGASANSATRAIHDKLRPAPGNLKPLLPV